ncbi:unnamed protein product [Dicrocoelium dendriticum]|nr:unnamed protein product [Dicrocoelium dendriticum]
MRAGASGRPAGGYAAPRAPAPHRCPIRHPTLEGWGGGGAGGGERSHAQLCGGGRGGRPPRPGGDARAPAAIDPTRGVRGAWPRAPAQRLVSPSLEQSWDAIGALPPGSGRRAHPPLPRSRPCQPIPLSHPPQPFMLAKASQRYTYGPPPDNPASFGCRGPHGGPVRAAAR